MFAYCNNNPIGMRDNSGQIPVLLVELIVIGSIITAVANNVNNAEIYRNAGDTAHISSDTYTMRKITKVEKMELAKQETGEEHYFGNAWRYYSEYTLHEYGWYLTGWALEKDIPLLSKIASHFETADLEKDKWDGRWYVDVSTFILGLMGP